MATLFYCYNYYSDRDLRLHQDFNKQTCINMSYAQELVVKNYGREVCLIFDSLIWLLDLHTYSFLGYQEYNNYWGS